MLLFRQYVLNLLANLFWLEVSDQHEPVFLLASLKPTLPLRPLQCSFVSGHLFLRHASFVPLGLARDVFVWQSISLRFLLATWTCGPHEKLLGRKGYNTV